MLNCRNNLQKNSARTLPTEFDIRSLWLLGLILLLLSGCAGQHEVAHPPANTMESPLSYLTARPNKDFQQAYSDYQRGEQAKARAGFQKILKKAPDYFPANLGIGYTYLAESNFDLAEKYIQKALDKAAGYPQAYFAMSQVYESRQDYDQALASLNQVMAIAADYPGLQQSRDIMKLKATEMHLSRGRALSDSDPEEAVRNFELARQLAPEIPEIPLEIGRVYIKENQCEQALPFLQEADTTMDSNVEVKSDLFNCYADLQKYDEAMQVYEALALIKPGDADMQKRVQSIRRILALRKLPEEYQMIPTTDRVTRSQLAAYLVLNLEFLKKYNSGMPSSIIVDTLDNWAKSEIQKVVDLGIMDIFPNRTFQASAAITKLELAKAASRILEILEADHRVNVEPSDTIIPDLARSNIYYPMVAHTLGAGVISLDNDGKFNVNRPVAGAELISMVNRFQALMER